MINRSLSLEQLIVNALFPVPKKKKEKKSKESKKQKDRKMDNKWMSDSERGKVKTQKNVKEWWRMWNKVQRLNKYMGKNREINSEREKQQTKNGLNL